LKPFIVSSKAPGVVGNPPPDVMPATTAPPSAASATSPAVPNPNAPMYVEYTSADPSGVRRVTNPSPLPVEDVSRAPGVTGKFVELVVPTTYALPVPSTATDVALSDPVPPRKVE
jgi:hypothetical protein